MDALPLPGKMTGIISCLLAHDISDRSTTSPQPATNEFHALARPGATPADGISCHASRRLAFGEMSAAPRRSARASQQSQASGYAFKHPTPTKRWP